MGHYETFLVWGNDGTVEARQVWVVDLPEVEELNRAAYAMVSVPPGQWWLGGTGQG
jgi:hypothetical protein